MKKNSTSLYVNRCWAT